MIPAQQVLQTAYETQTQRGVDYDKPDGERSMGRTVAAFNAITGQNLTESEGWEFMLCLKQVRMFTAQGYHADSCIDAVSYAALLAESKSKEGIK